MKKIFINYSWEHDSQNAEQLYSMLSEYNEFNIWMDKHNMQGGLQWRPAIRKAIRESDFFISVLSSKSIKDRGERNKEIYLALDVLREFPPGEVYLIPTRIDDCIPPWEDMNELNWVNLFPDWDAGFKNLLRAVGNNNVVKKSNVQDNVEILPLKYHYRVGMIDLDMNLLNIPEILAQLNSIQKYFLFTNPGMPVLKNNTKVYEGTKNFAVQKVPESYISEHRHLAVDLLACITKYPLAFNSYEYNMFAGPSEKDERFLFISADSLHQYCRQAGCIFEEGIVFILVSQLIGYFTEIDYHEETRKCVMDFCEDRDDLVFGLESRTLCKQCSKQLPEGELKTALMKLLKWKYL
jgi:hypothetical protein